MAKVPCGKCNKIITKGSFSVLCRATCLKWYHLKCTNLDKEDLKNIDKSRNKWSCERCLLIDVNDGSKEEDEAVQSDLIQELESVNEVVNTLNDDLNYANEQIKNLRSHNSQLEILVIEKQGTIELLERKIKELNHCSYNPNINVSPSFSTILKRKKENIRRSLPLTNRSKTDLHEESFVRPNRFELLADLDEGPAVAPTHTEHAKRKSTKKLLLLADSHGRDLAWNLNECISTHEAFGFVRPGGRSEQILNNNNIEEENLKEDDILVIMTGSNDVAANESSKAVQYISTAVKKASKTNKVVLVELPNRYDLKDWSCVNKEVKKTNNILKDLCKKNPNLILVEASKAERRMHTQHGQHLNGRGKQWLAEQINSAIKGSSANEKEIEIEVGLPSPGMDVHHQEENTSTTSTSGNSPPAESQKPPEVKTPLNS